MIEKNYAVCRVFDYALDYNRTMAYHDWIKDNIEGWDQMILEFYTIGEPSSGWVHCSVADKPRKQFLRAFKEDGKTKYKPILGDIRCG